MKLDNLKETMSKNLACNIKNYSKSFYAYVMSKQNLRDKVGSLEDSAENIISQDFLCSPNFVKGMNCCPNLCFSALDAMLRVCVGSEIFKILYFLNLTPI